MMEQVFLWNEENQSRNNSESRSQQVVTKVFPKLRKVELDRLPNLETFYQGIEGIEFPLLETMYIRKCPKMKFIRSNESSGSSSSATIDDDSAHLFYKVSFGNLKMLRADMIPFWGHKFPLSHFYGLVKLIFYEVNGCKSLIPSSVAINLLKLRILKIENCCDMLKVIEDEAEKEKVVSGGERVILFPKLEELYLRYLPKLVTFCEWECGVVLCLLREVSIQGCPVLEDFSLESIAAPNLEAFKTDFNNKHELGVDESRENLESEKPFFCFKLFTSVFKELKELQVHHFRGSSSLLTSSVSKNLDSLRKLEIMDCSEIVKVIEDKEEKEKVVSGGERAMLFPKLEELYLHYLPKLVTFCEWECGVVLCLLREVSIQGCPVLEDFSLGSIAAPNLEAFKTDFNNKHELGVDESVENSESEKPSFFCYKFFLSIFKGLKELEVHQFRGSLSLFTSSVSKNLDSLRRLDIWECSEIVKVIEDEAEDEKVANSGEMSILFPKLEVLTLWFLPKLVCFCEWKCDVKFPSLRKCFIFGCSDMKSFTMGFIAAPNLEDIEINGGIAVAKDLNGALQQPLFLKQEEQDEDNEEEHDEDSEEEHEG